MYTRIATHHFFNAATQRALLEDEGGYVRKEESQRSRLSLDLGNEALEPMLLLHLGQNPEGCAPEVAEWLADRAATPDLRRYLADYPECQGSLLRGQLGKLHGIDPEWIMVTAGLDQMVDMLAATFIEQRDKYLVTNPGFFLFEEYSNRQGGVAVELNLLEEDDFCWTAESLEAFKENLRLFDIKLVWLANPNNPSGRLMSLEQIEELVALARKRWVMVVVDEAYGEYCDGPDAPNSASSLLARFDNLVVLRTFSKAYGLAGARVGYAMSSNPEIRNGLRVHRHYYPVSRLALDLATHALIHRPYLETVRSLARQRQAFFSEALKDLPDIRVLPSDSGIGMIRWTKMTAASFASVLEHSGVILAPVPGSGVAAEHYLRLTYGQEAQMRRVIAVIRRLVEI